MRQTVIYPALFSMLLAAGCALLEQPSTPTAAKTSAERLSVHGMSQDIIADAKQTATEHCTEQNKHFTFLRNICRRKSMLGIEWLTCDLYFACTAEGEQPPVLPAHVISPDETATDQHGQPVAPSDTAINKTPEDDKQPAKVEAALPKKNQDPCGLGDPESLGPEPLGPGDAQPSAPDQTISVEILK